MGKTLKAQGQSDKKISDLEAAIGRMKQHQELLQQRLKDEAERKAKLEVNSPIIVATNYTLYSSIIKLTFLHQSKE